MKKLSSDQFKEKAGIVHKNKYIYDKVVYVNSRTKICIICPQHGEFWQLANAHLQGQGCPVCSKEVRKPCTTKDDLLNKFRILYKDKYSYDLSKFTKLTDQIKIFCPKHGWYLQRAINHLNGHQCPLCTHGKKYTTSEFILRAREVHGDKYDYSKSIYSGKDVPVEIICSTHGSFWQKPHDHIVGCGCPKCNTSKKQWLIYKKLCECFPDETWEWEYSAKWLGLQRIDIYNAKLKLAIEYNGEQHYKSVDIFGGDAALQIQKIRDSQKLDKMTKHGCIIYIIPYYEFDIETILKTIKSYIYENR